MIDHLSTYATDYPATVAFYDAVFSPLGYAKNMEMTTEWDPEFPTRRICAFGLGPKPTFWVIEVKAENTATPRHVAFVAADRAAVDAFHAAGLAAGAKDHGAPGERPQYHPGYYGAFLLDPDGNNVEAVHHGQP